MKRVLELDFIKAIAILFMVYTHVAIFFYDFSEPFFNTLSDIGGYISLTLFLFASGANLPLMMKRYSKSELAIKFLKRAAGFFTLYVVVALFITGGQQLGPILTLQHMPILADFIFAFVLFFLLAIVLVYLLPRLRSEWLLLLFIGLYIFGYFMYYQSGSDIFIPIKSVLVGHADLHRFPLFQYAIVYVLGVIFTQQRKWFSQARLSSLLLILLPLASVMIYLTGLERWVASPGFLLYGLVAALILLLIYQVIAANKLITSWAYSLSVRVSGILVAHIFLVVGLAKLISERYGAIELVVLSFVVLYISWWLGKWIKV